MAIDTKLDLIPSLGDEAKKHRELFEIGSNRTTTGSGTYISATSLTSYNYTAGTQDLFEQLGVVLQDYNIDQGAWDSIQTTIDGLDFIPKDQFDQVRVYHQDTGVADAMIVVTSPTVDFDFTLNGNILPIIPLFDNTGATTIVVDGSITYDVVKWDTGTSAYVALEAGDIGKNKQIDLRWDIAGRFVLSPSGGGSIKSTQRGSTTALQGAILANITISSVDITKSIPIVTVRAGANNTEYLFVKAELTSSTNLRLTRDSAIVGTTIVEWQVVELSSISNLQKLTGSIDITTTAFKDISISSVDLSKAFVIGTTQSDVGNVYGGFFTYQLTTSTNVRISTYTTISPATASYVIYVID